ncbi:MAG: glycosyltransferase [Prevotella sp.]|nr:glycosyltransferase [Prevotella sp.]
MKRVAVLGHFGFGADKANGQTIKTKIVTDEVCRQLGANATDLYDTAGGWHFLLRLPIVIVQLLSYHKNIIFMPAHKGVRVIVPLMVVLNMFFRRKLHYVVIGGWLPQYINNYSILRLTLRKVDCIYVETRHMYEELLLRGYHNILIMPNCKPLDIVAENELQHPIHPPFRLCTFSRVMKEKGIEDAILAIKKCNEISGRVVYTLDIYGMIEKKQTQWFNELMKEQPKTIKYAGIVPFNHSTQVLRSYFALLFPTHFKTEGFAGTLVDAMSAGVPPIASDCTSNIELINQGHTGWLYNMGAVDQLTHFLIECADTPAIINDMRVQCVRRAADFLPEQVCTTLITELI